MKFPAVKGDQLRVEVIAPKTGKFASQDPRIKKQSMANQHMQIMTPHCGCVTRDKWVVNGPPSGDAERIA